VARAPFLPGAAGLNAKLERFATVNALPRKLIFVGKYLGNIRNAADHGLGDPDVAAPWTIQESNGNGIRLCGVFIHQRGNRKRARTAVEDLAEPYLALSYRQKSRKFCPSP